jgi:hypothetical protein
MTPIIPPQVEPCDHDWKFCDESFDHEYGCERVHVWRCEKCDAEKPVTSADYDGPEAEEAIDRADEARDAMRNLPLVP